MFPEGGHVVRFDSVSKLLSAGIRLVCLLYILDVMMLTDQGFVSGPQDILHSMDVTTASKLR